MVQAYADLQLSQVIALAGAEHRAERYCLSLLPTM
jgi:hypothetical protein